MSDAIFAARNGIVSWPQPHPQSSIRKGLVETCRATASANTVNDCSASALNTRIVSGYSLHQCGRHGQKISRIDVGIIDRGRLLYQGPLRELPGYGRDTLEDVFFNVVAQSSRDLS
jgi:hypothetical protein